MWDSPSQQVCNCAHRRSLSLEFAERATAREHLLLRGVTPVSDYLADLKRAEHSLQARHHRQRDRDGGRNITGSVLTVDAGNTA
jgi:hypothetical protein